MKAQGGQELVPSWAGNLHVPDMLLLREGHPHVVFSLASSSKSKLPSQENTRRDRRDVVECHQEVYVGPRTGPALEY